MIEAFHLAAACRGATLFEELTLAFDEGEAWIVTGPPSSGKTLLLRMLAGDRKPDSGDVLALGESLYRGGPAARSRFRAISGSVPESVHGARGRTAGDLFRLSALAGGGIPGEERRRREEELLALVGLEGALGIPLSSLSVSERTRIALAAELLRGPKVLFLDMVLANAGEGWTDHLLGLVRALAREGGTIVLAERSAPGGEPPAKGGEPEAGPQEGVDGAVRVAGPFRLVRLAGGGASPRRPEPGALPEEPAEDGPSGGAPGGPGEGEES